MRKTKIVCTLGPATESEEVIEKMLLAGMNVARLNFSHGTHESHTKMINRFRSVRDRLEKPAAVMLDTKGPEIRLCSFKDGKAEFKEGDTVTLTTDTTVLGDNHKVAVSFDKLPSQVKKGNTILIDDGKIYLGVVDCTETEVICTVKCGGIVKDKKGINIPMVHIDMPYLSEQDKSDLLWGIEHDVDYIAASFVRSKDDVIALRKFLDYNGGHFIKIISKIENIEGVNNFDEILELSDGIMVARGDMGVEIEYEKLPGIQKKAIRSCYQSGKVAITATQMLESMINNPIPTRAEISDVANAVFDGTSAVMLSGESAAGKYPVRAVKTMAKIAAQAETDAFDMNAYSDMKYEIDFTDTTNAMCDAACTTARDLNVQAIIAVTKHGQTARRMSKFRPYEPIVAATPVEKTYHQLSLSWGVYPALARYQLTTDDLFIHAVDCAKQIDMVKDGDKVVITAGIPLDTPGNTNMIKVQIVGDLRRMSD